MNDVKQTHLSVGINVRRKHHVGEGDAVELISILRWFMYYMHAVALSSHTKTLTGRLHDTVEPTRTQVR